MKDFRIVKKVEHRLIPYAFEEDSHRVYEEVAGVNKNASADEF